MNDKFADEIERMKREAGGRNQFALWLLTNVDEIIAALRRSQPEGEMVRSFLEQFKAASEERWQFLSECEREAAKYRAQGDMLGWNFHMGMSSGANQADLMYQRVYLAMLSAEAEGRKS